MADSFPEQCTKHEWEKSSESCCRCLTTPAIASSGTVIKVISPNWSLWHGCGAAVIISVFPAQSNSAFSLRLYTLLIGILFAEKARAKVPPSAPNPIIDVAGIDIFSENQLIENNRRVSAN